MYVKSETDTERSLCIEKVLEDLPGGGTVDPDDFKTVSTSMLEGALVGADGNGLYHLFKTAKIVTGGTASAPRIESEHELKVDDVISDGHVALTIATITVGSTYDTLAFDSGSLSIYADDTILYQVETEDTAGSGAAAKAQVQDTGGDYLDVSFTAVDTPALKNGITLTIAQAGGDALAVAYADGVLTISLANSTAAKNNVAAIQAAIRALTTVEGIDFSSIVCEGTDWDDKQTGATLTTASDTFQAGVNYTRVSPLYTPAGIAMQGVDLTTDIDNQGCGIMVKGTVIESLLPYYVDSDIKALLPFVHFK